MADCDYDRFLTELLDAQDIAACAFDADDRTLFWNRAFLRFFPEHVGHVARGEPYRANLLRFYDSRLVGAERANIERYVQDGIDRHHAQTRPFVFSHRGRRLRVAALVMPQPAGGRIRLWRELPARSLGAEVAAPGAGVAADLLESIADGAMVVDQQDRIVSANHEFLRLYDVPTGGVVTGMTLAEVVRHAWTGAGEGVAQADIAVLDNIRFAGAPFELELPGGRWRRVIAQASESGLVYFTHADITPLKRAVTEMSALAGTDALTGLPNRRRFGVVLDEVWRRCTEDGLPLALVMVDVDHFKAVNDRFGHLAGDMCLQRVALLIDGCVHRPQDLAVRYGGEEFAVLLGNTGQAGAVAVAERVQAALADEDWQQTHPGLTRVTASLGICAVATTLGGSPAELIRRADEALYRAKHGGRNRIALDGPA